MPPVHPGSILREDILKEMQLSVAEASVSLNVNSAKLLEIVNESASIDAEMALRLEEAFGITADFWLDMQKACDLWRIKQSGIVKGIQRISMAS